MAGLQVHTAETEYAVTQAEIKAWNKIDSSDDDTVVALIERAVHNWAKEYTARSLTTVTYQLFIDSLYQVDIPIQEGSYVGIDQSKLVPLLVKTIQELEARITALESE